MTSGIILNDKVQWVTFHSGYDFGYLLKVVTCQPLPNDESEFFELLKVHLILQNPSERDAVVFSNGVRHQIFNEVLQ